MTIAPDDTAMNDVKIRFIDKRQVMARVHLTFPAIWQFMREGRFPLARKVGNKAMWLAHEIDDWMLGLPPKNYKPIDSATTPRKARKATASESVEA